MREPDKRQPLGYPQKPTANDAFFVDSQETILQLNQNSVQAHGYRDPF